MTSDGLYSLNISTSYTTYSLSTKPDSATGTNTDNINMDTGTAGGVRSTLGESGSNSHSFDVGYEPCTPPTVVFTASSSSICQGAPVTLTTTATSTETYSYSISAPTGVTLSATNSASAIATGLAVGVNTFTVTASNSLTCSTTATVSVIVIAAPAITLLATQSTICVGQTIDINVLGVTVGSTINTSVLGGLGSLLGAVTSFSVSPTVTTTYSVTASPPLLGLLGGCPSIAQTTIVVDPLPALQPLDISLCATVGTLVDLNAILTANQSSSALLGLTNVFTRLGVGGTIANPTTVSLTAGVNSFSVVSTGVGGCTATTPLNVILNATPALLPISLSLCAGTTLNLASLTALTGLTNIFRTGDLLGVGTVVGTPINVSINAGVNLFNVTSTAPNGCTAATPISVTGIDLPALLPVSVSLCAAVGTPVNLNTILTANQSSSTLLGLTNVFAGLSGTLANPTAISLTAGINSFSVVSTGVGGCTATTPVTITVNTGPALLPVSLSLCAAVGTPVNLSAILSANQSSTSLLGLTNVFAGLGGIVANPLTVNLTAGVNSFSVISTGLDGCTATTPLTLTVNAPPALLPVSVSLCVAVGTPVDLNAILTANQSNTTLLGLTNVFAGVGGTIADPLKVSLSAGINNFSVISTGVGGCTATTPLTIDLTPGPGLLPVSLSLCAAVGTPVNLSAILTANQSSTSLLGLTNVFAGLGGNIANPLTVNLSAGINSFSIISTGTGSCTATTPLTLTLNAPPTLLPVSVNLCAEVGTAVNLNAILTANQSNSALLGLTNVFAGLSGTLANPTAVSLAAGVNSFLVISTSVSGCTATTPITVNLTSGPGLLPVSLSLCAAVGTPVNLSAILTANQSGTALLGLTNVFAGVGGTIADPLTVSLSAGINSFSVVSTGVSGCTATTPLTINLTPSPGLLPVSLSLCAAVGTPVNLSAILTANQSNTALLGLTNVFAGLSGTIANPLTVNLSAGINSFSVVSTGVGGCAATTPLTITLNTLPALLPVSLSLCAAVGTPINLNTILTANQSTTALLGLTNVFAGLTGQIANPLAVSLVAGVNSFSVVSTNISGCTATTPITVNLTPGPGLQPVSLSLCAAVGTPVNLSAILTANQSSTVLLGLTNAFVGLSGQIANPLAVSLSAGINSFSVVSTGVGNCTATTPLTLTVNTPTALLPVSVSLCVAVGTAVDLTAILTANQSSSALLGLTNVFASLTGQIANPLSVSLNAGINSFSVVSTGVGGCTATTPITINLTSGPALLPVSLSLCAAVGTPVNLSAILTANQSSSALLGLTNVFAGLTGQIANPLSVSLSAGVNSFSTISTGVGGCTAVTPLTINLMPGPGLLPVNVSLCATIGTPVNLSAILTANQSSTVLLGLTSIFANVNGQIANPLAVSLNAGINSFSVISTGVGSCTATTSLNVTLNTPPILSPVSASLCAAIGAPLNLSAILTANQSSTALLGLTNVFVGVNGAIANPFAVSLSAGINSFSVVSTSVGNCTITTPLTIVLTPEPKLDVIITAVTCSSATNQYTLSGTVSLTNAQASVLTITDGVVSTTIAVTNSTTAVSFTLPAQASGASNHMVMASLPGCTTANSPIMRTVTYTSPASCTVRAPLLTIDKRVSNSVAAVGSILTYTIVVANVGTAAATNVVVTDSSSAGLRYVANSATSLTGITFVQGNPFSTWIIDALAVGQSVTLTFQAIADSAGILYNKASIPGDTVSVCTSVPFRVCAGESYAFNLTAPAGRSSYRWFRIFNGVTTELTSFTTNVLQVTVAGSYSLAASNAASSCSDFSCCPFIVEEDSVPVFAARTIPVTCTGNALQANGQIILSNFQSGYTYQYSLGATFNKAASLSGAVKAIPTNGIIAANLANPATAQAYTIRVYNATGCHTDVTVTLMPTVCNCPADTCVPYVVSQTRRPVRIGDPR